MALVLGLPELGELLIQSYLDLDMYVAGAILLMLTFFIVVMNFVSDIALAALLTLVALMAGLMLIAVGAASARQYFRSEKGARTLNRTAGSVMIGAGAYLASRG